MMRRSSKLLTSTGLATLVATSWFAVAASAHAAPDYGQRGSVAFTRKALPVVAGGPTGGAMVTPNGAGPYPVVIASHGFLASSANQVGWAEHFASWGFIVLAPDLPNPPNTMMAVGYIEALVRAGQAEANADRRVFGLEGHSAGGLASTAAAARLKPNALVLFDPVDRDDIAKTALPTVCSPTLTLFAAAGACNNRSQWKTFSTTMSGPAVQLDVVGATHCDGENADRGIICSAACGGGAATDRQTTHARLATAFFLANLKGDAEAAGTLTVAALGADTRLANVREKAGTPCAPVPVADAGAGEGGVSSSSGAASSSGASGTASSGSSGTSGASSSSSGAGDAPAAGDGGDGCNQSSRAGASGAATLGLIGLLLGARRRRSRR
jgi:dienelactone hydrolase